MNKHTILGLSLSLAACSGTGKLDITTWGEAYIEQQIPVQMGEEPGFVDGYTVRYDKFLVALSDLRVANHHGEVGATMREQRVFDLHKTGPTSVISFAEIPADEWDQVSLVVKPASGAQAGNADAADVATMNSGGYSVYVVGHIDTATRSWAFSWGFKTATKYEECESAEKQVGVVVPSGGTATVQLTIHGDHLFYDDLQSPDTKLRAREKVQADDGDRVLTLAELEAVDLTTLPTGTYGTGGDGTVEDLGAFVTALSRTVVHYQGEGECHAVDP